MDDYTALYLYLTRCSLVVTLVVQLLPLEAQQEAPSSPRTAPVSARVGARIRFLQLEADLAHVWAHLVSVRESIDLDLLDGQQARQHWPSVLPLPAAVDAPGVELTGINDFDCTCRCECEWLLLINYSTNFYDNRQRFDSSHAGGGARRIRAASRRRSEARGGRARARGRGRCRHVLRGTVARWRWRRLLRLPCAAAGNHSYVQ